MGQKTGDLVCTDCGACFLPKESIPRPEHRSGIITSVHAMLIAMRANDNLVINENFQTRHQGVFDWCLVDETKNLVIPVSTAVAQEAKDAGII